MRIEFLMEQNISKLTSMHHNDSIKEVSFPHCLLLCSNCHSLPHEKAKLPDEDLAGVLRGVDRAWHQLRLLQIPSSSWPSSLDNSHSHQVHTTKHRNWQCCKRSGWRLVIRSKARNWGQRVLLDFLHYKYFWTLHLSSPASFCQFTCQW